MAVYTTIDDPSAHFQTLTYTASTATPSQTFTNDGNSDLKPDFLWIKNRSGWGSRDHALFDSSRGVNKRIRSNNTNAEDTMSYQTFNTNGFTVPESFETAYAGPYVAWQWKANGGTTATNTSGTVNSVVQANTDAGFSIATVTSPSSNGHWSFGHGLGVKPDMVITRQRSGGGWWTWHKDLTNQTTYYLGLNSNSAQTNEANMWGGGMTSSVVGVSSPNSTLANEAYVAYCFASKQGYSKFGKYVGNGNADGTFVYLGFKPAWVMIKPVTAVEQWVIIDGTRSPSNQAMKQIKADDAGAEYDGASVTNGIDILSNGFKVRTSRTEINTNGVIYIYMAFAENPFVTSTGVPTTAR